MIGLLDFAVGVCCVWRLTHLAVGEDGPFRLFSRIRARTRTSGPSYWSGLLGCHYCASLVIAAPVAALLSGEWREGLPLWPALSAGSILLERFAKLHLPDYHEDAP